MYKEKIRSDSISLFLTLKERRGGGGGVGGSLLLFQFLKSERVRVELD